MTTIAREVERKLDLAGDVALDALHGWQVERAEPLVLTAHYYDTTDRRLARAGHALRQRTDQHGTTTWSLKTTRAQHGSHAERDEIDVVRTSPRVPPELRAVLAAVVGERSLRRHATIVTRRSPTVLRRGDDVVELVVDEVSSVVGRRAGPSFRELELELLAGHEAALDELETFLIAHGASPSSWASKLQHVLGTLPTTPPPRTVADLVAAACDHAVQRLLLHDPALRLTGDVEAVHQARVATRRLRSDLRSLRPFLDRDTARGLRAELAWLAGVLGAVRDLDVIAARIDFGIAGLDEPAPSARQLLTAMLAAERAPALDEVRAALTSPRYLALVAAVRRAAEEPPLAADVDPGLPAKPAAKVVTARSWRGVRRVGRPLRSGAHEQQLHELRKLAKQARYAHELVAPLSGTRSATRRQHIEAMQDVLGELQDTVITRAWLRRAVAGCPPDVAFVAGRLHEREAGRAAELRAAWQRPFRAADGV